MMPFSVTPKVLRSEPFERTPVNWSARPELTKLPFEAMRTICVPPPKIEITPDAVRFESFRC